MGAYGTRGSTVGIDVVNTEQAEAWDGHEGDVWTDQADRYDRGEPSRLAALPGAAHRPRERSRARHRLRHRRPDTGGRPIASGGAVLGIDLSTRMLELARTRSAEQGLDNVTFAHGDAQVFPFEPESVDLAMSSFGAMFFNDPVAAFTNIGGAVTPGGTLALMAWRTLPENEWLMALRGALALGRELPVPPPDAPTPFSLADPDARSTDPRCSRIRRHRVRTGRRADRPRRRRCGRTRLREDDGDRRGPHRGPRRPTSERRRWRTSRGSCMSTRPRKVC